MALPTHQLMEEIQHRCLELGVPCRSINDKESEGKRVKSLQGVLERKEPLVLTTHSALLLVDDAYLEPYTLVIDEVPPSLEIFSKKLSSEDLKVLLAHLNIEQGQLSIQPNKSAEIDTLVKAYKQASINDQIGTTCSELTYQIYDVLLGGGVVTHKILPQKQNHVLCAAKISPIFDKITRAHAVHLLAASDENGLFAVIAKAKGFEFKTSEFEPPEFNYSGNITLFPLMDAVWSKGRALRNKDGEPNYAHIGEKGKQFIDEAILLAYEHSENGKILLFRNNWFKTSAVMDYDRLTVCPSDSRGLNNLSDCTAAILVYSGQANPNHVPALQALAEKLGTRGSELLDAWHVTHKLERVLQDAARTGVRRRNNKDDIRLYLQDMEVCEYLIAHGMPSARINKFLMRTVPKAKNCQKGLSTSDQFILDSLESKLKKKEIIKGLINMGMGKSTAYVKIDAISSLLAANSQPAVAVNFL